MSRCFGRYCFSARFISTWYFTAYNGESILVTARDSLSFSHGKGLRRRRGRTRCLRASGIIKGETPGTVTRVSRDHKRRHPWSDGVSALLSAHVLFFSHVAGSANRHSGNGLRGKMCGTPRNPDATPRTPLAIH